MATAKRKRKKKTSPWEQEYRITKIDPTLREIEEVVVLGSRDALFKQEAFEDEGYFAIVYNITKEDEEYRTPGAEDYKRKASS
jgi:hypothetical protein